MSKGYKFTVGEYYKTQDGNTVKVISRHTTPGNGIVVCSDGLHRYDRFMNSSDAGRVTGSDTDYSHGANFVREATDNQEQADALDKTNTGQAALDEHHGSEG